MVNTVYLSKIYAGISSAGAAFGNLTDHAIAEPSDVKIVASANGSAIHPPPKRKPNAKVSASSGPETSTPIVSTKVMVPCRRAVRSVLTIPVATLLKRVPHPDPSAVRIVPTLMRVRSEPNVIIKNPRGKHRTVNRASQRS